MYTWNTVVPHGLFRQFGLDLRTYFDVLAVRSEVQSEEVTCLDQWKRVSVQLGPTIWQFHQIRLLAVFMYDVREPLGFFIVWCWQVTGTTFLE